MLDQAALKELLSRKVVGRRKREAVTHLRSLRLTSERRVCILVCTDRNPLYYRSRWAPDAELRSRLAISPTSAPRFGDRRLFIVRALRLQPYLSSLQRGRADSPQSARQQISLH